MSVAIITGSAGLVGSEASTFFARQGMDVIGIDNDMRRRFFGDEASTRWNRARLERDLGERYQHCELDIRDASAIDALFARPWRELDAEESRTRSAHACGFAYPGTYGHECGRRATTVARHASESTVSGVYWARRCPGCAALPRNFGENRGLTDWQPFNPVTHRNVWK